MSAFKAQATMRELKQRLQLLMPTATIQDALDADGFPAITVTYSTEKAAAKIITDGNAGRVDGLGLPQRSYSPHIAEMIQDSDQVTQASKELKIKMVSAMSLLGMKLYIKEEIKANIDTTPANFDADFAASTDLVKLPSDAINPLIQSQ